MPERRLFAVAEVSEERLDDTFAACSADGFHRGLAKLHGLTRGEGDERRTRSLGPHAP